MAQESIDRFLAKYDPAIEKEGRAARRVLRKAMPTAFELVYDNYNALVFAFGASERAGDILMSIALYPRWVTLFFLHGATLDDPESLLEGSGKTIRGVPDRRREGPREAAGARAHRSGDREGEDAPSQERQGADDHQVGVAEEAPARHKAEAMKSVNKSVRV